MIWVAILYRSVKYLLIEIEENLTAPTFYLRRFSESRSSSGSTPSVQNNFGVPSLCNL